MDHASNNGPVAADGEYDVSQARDFVEHYRLNDFTTCSAWFIALGDGEDETFCRDCLATRAMEMIELRTMESDIERLRWKMLNRMGDTFRLVLGEGELESDPREAPAAVDKCLAAGATPLACMELILSTMTADEAGFAGW
jgi:hypothetical protein